MKVMDTMRARLVVVLALFVGLLAFSPAGPVTAWSEACTDSWPGVSVQLVDGDFGLPLWLGFESGVLDGQPGHIGLCYGTGAPGDNKTAGGFAKITVVPGSGDTEVTAANGSDSNSANQVNAIGYAHPTYSLSTGSTGGGQSLTFTIPVAICSGPCQPANQPADGTTGVIVGTISQTPTSPGGSSASYGITGLCIQVDGATVVGDCTAFLGDAGVTTTGTRPDTWGSYDPGPCVVGFCAYSYSYTGTTGNQLATVYVPGLGAIPVYGVHTCLYTRDATTTCPY